MSHCEDEGRHKVIFLNKEDADPEKSTVQLAPIDPEENGPQGLIAADGSINWGCPCLGGMAVGPCAVEFRSAFECFHYSTEETKGADCFDKFNEMQECMKKHPELYEESEKVIMEDSQAMAEDDSAPKEPIEAAEKEVEEPIEATDKEVEKEQS